jgi:hypothetical protein
MYYKERKRQAVFTVKSFIRVAKNADIAETAEESLLRLIRKMGKHDTKGEVNKIKKTLLLLRQN